MKYLLGLAMLDGHVYAVGGWEGSSRLDSVERYDPETNTWSPVASLKMAVTSPAVVAHEGKGKITRLRMCFLSCMYVRLFVKDLSYYLFYYIGT